MKFAALEGKRVAVWGAGREGRAALVALGRRLPDLPVTLLCSPDEARAFGTGDPGPGTGKSKNWLDDALLPPRLTISTDEPDASALGGFDIVIKSPGISAYKPEILAAQRQSTIFTSGTALWFGENPDARVIGVTGTKGKSTTAAMIAHMARSLGLRTALAGNIGLPLLELDRQAADLWVVELSSFQTGEAGPLAVGVVTCLYQEHLDWHGTAERYISDKLRLAAVAHTLLVSANQPDLLTRSAAHPQRVLFGDAHGWHLAQKVAPCPSGGHGNEEQTQAFICRGSESIVEASIVHLPGEHNRLNACAALSALELAGFDAVAASTSLAEFRPLPHRLQMLGECDGIAWIDDSISTAPQAVLAAIDSLALRPLTVIVGGHDRGLDWSELAATLGRMQQVHLVLQGDSAERIGAALKAAGVGFKPCRTLDEAVRLAREATPRGAAVVLSPGAPSFDQFRDYTERGRRFAELAGFDPGQEGTIPGVGIA